VRKKSGQSKRIAKAIRIEIMEGVIFKNSLPKYNFFQRQIKKHLEFIPKKKYFF